MAQEDSNDPGSSMRMRQRIVIWRTQKWKFGTKWSLAPKTVTSDDGLLLKGVTPRFVSGEIDATAVYRFNEQMVRQFKRPRECVVGGSGVFGRYEYGKRLDPKYLKRIDGPHRDKQPDNTGRFHSPLAELQVATPCCRRHYDAIGQIKQRKLDFGEDLVGEGYAEES